MLLLELIHNIRSDRIILRGKMPHLKILNLTSVPDQTIKKTTWSQERTQRITKK